MSRILRRPMFRKGGEVGGGIMTGVMRENYDEGTPRPSERITKVLEQFSEPAFDPVSQLLIHILSNNLFSNEKQHFSNFNHHCFCPRRFTLWI